MSVIIVGAGTAGITAGRELVRAGREVVILEAKDRIGGRVYTDYDFAEYPIELGAEFLHGEHIPTWQFVRELGLTTVLWKRQHDSLVRMGDGSQRTMSEARRLYEDFELTRTWAFPNKIAPYPHETFEAYLSRIGLSENQLAYVRRMFGNAAGEGSQTISAAGALSDIERRAKYGYEDHRILQGYSRVIDHMAQGLDIRLGTVVEAVEWNAQGVKVTTNAGVLHAEQVIITLPLGVLKAGGLHFGPSLPSERLEAMNKLAFAPAVKLVYRFDDPILPSTVSSVYSPMTPPMWWTSAFERPNITSQVWTAFTTGAWARQLLERGEEAALQKGLETLRKELDQSALQPSAMKIMNWGAEPFTLGGYSAMLPQGESARATLAKPIAHKIYWAGEATASNETAGTVHGAYLTGLRAAQEILG